MVASTYPHMIDQMAKQISALPKWVQLWMRWLNIVFLIGLFFVVEHVEARWAIAAYLDSFPVGFLAFYYVRDIRITGLPHLLFWAPLGVYLVHRTTSDPAFSWMSLFGLWIALLCATIFISVIFDVRGLRGISR